METDEMHASNHAICFWFFVFVFYLRFLFTYPFQTFWLSLLWFQTLLHCTLEQDPKWLKEREFVCVFFFFFCNWSQSILNGHTLCQYSNDQWNEINSFCEMSVTRYADRNLGYEWSTNGLEWKILRRVFYVPR